MEEPIEEVRDYFGDQIAMYFAFLSFYTRWLSYPAIVGLAFQVGKQRLERNAGGMGEGLGREGEEEEGGEGPGISESEIDLDLHLGNRQLGACCLLRVHHVLGMSHDQVLGAKAGLSAPFSSPVLRPLTFLSPPFFIISILNSPPLSSS